MAPQICKFAGSGSRPYDILAQINSLTATNCKPYNFCAAFKRKIYQFATVSSNGLIVDEPLIARVTFKVPHAAVNVSFIGFNECGCADFVLESSVMDTEPKRIRDQWTQFEIRQLLREYRRGDSVETIAVRHQRTNLAIRARIIAIGAVDPSLQNCRLRNRRTERGAISAEMLGLELNPLALFPRDHYAWTEAEIALASQSYREELSVQTIAKVHRRHALSILCPIYEHFEEGRFELVCRSEEEAHLRFERLQQYTEYCGHALGGR